MNLLAAILAAAPLWQQPTPLMQKHFGAELPTIVEAAQANDCHSDQLFTVLLAIRKAENGGQGREFGILHPRALNQPHHFASKPVGVPPPFVRTTTDGSRLEMAVTSSSS